MTSIRVITLGCSKNTVDTEHILGMLPQDRFEIVNDGPSDILLLNTCGFIGDAKEESVNAILQAVAAKADGQFGKVAVFGCLSQRYAGELPTEIPEVDAWFGARDLDPLVRWLGVEPVHSHERFVSTPGKPYAYLKISEGCDRSCSYCAIPAIRGAHRSVSIEDLVREARFLAGSGVKELILIAQDTTYYGIDLYRRRALGELLSALSKIEGIEWIRIHYSYPDSFPEDVLDAMATNPKICPYLDIPLQHISDRVLSMMHRHTTGDNVRSLIRRFREKVPDIVLRTTLIVGHPGEDEEQFDELLDFVRQSRFERLGAFEYSEEEGTYAALNYEDSVPPEVKQRRYDALMSLQSDISRSFNESRVGRTERVLVDDCVDGMLVCRSRYESPDVDGEILVKAPENAAGLISQFVDVRIVAAGEYDLVAELL